MDKCLKTEELVERMNYISPYMWYHEFQDGVHAIVCVNEVNYDIWFGHNNETFGASVTGDEGEDLGYIETHLVFEDVEVNILAEVCIARVKQYIKGRLNQ